MSSVRFVLLAWLGCIAVAGCSPSSRAPLPPPDHGPFAVLRQVWSRERLVLHTAPDTSSPPVRALPPGVLLKVTSAEGNWYFVMVTDSVGGWGWVVVTQTTTEQPPQGVAQAVAFQEEQFLREYYQNRYEGVDWEKAQRADTVLAYLGYIEKYVFVTTSRCIPEAIDRVEELTWNFVAREDTFESYTKYLEFFPGGTHSQEARKHLFRLISSQRRPLPDFWKAFRQVQLPNLDSTKDALLVMRQQGQRLSCPFASQASS